MALTTRSNGQNIDASWFNDIKNELENAGTSMDAYALLAGRTGDVYNVDEIKEFTTDAGVKIESLLHKDNSIVDTTANTGILLKSNDNATQATINQSGLALKTGVAVNAILDEDNFASDSATSVPTQQSTGAFIASSIAASEALAQNNIWIGDSGGDRKAVRCSSGDVTDVYARVAEATVTISNASPAVVTQTTHGFNSGDKVVFSTTGALPTGVSAATLYYVKVIDGNTYYLSSSIANLLAGTYINTSDAGSGTHTAHSNGLYFTSALLRGTFTSDDASQGFVGEYLESQTSLSSVGPTGTAFSGTTLSLTAGDWEAMYTVELRPNGASFSSVNVIVAITGATGNSLTGFTSTVTGIEDLNQTPTTFSRATFQTQMVRVKSNGTDLIINGTTFSTIQVLQGKIYVGNFTVATPQYIATLRARRVR